MSGFPVADRRDDGALHEGDLIAISSSQVHRARNLI
jgi:hypothetical protein